MIIKSKYVKICEKFRIICENYENFGWCVKIVKICEKKMIITFLFKFEIYFMTNLINKLITVTHKIVAHLIFNNLGISEIKIEI